MRSTPLLRQSRLVPIAVLCAAAAINACRSTDETRVSIPPVIEVAVSRATSVHTNRVPGGRPGGAGDPRRYGSASPAVQARGTVNPAGSYAFTFMDDGKPMTGTMEVQGAPGTYTGRINAEARPEVQISTVTASGPLVTVTADVPNGVLVLRFKMTGDSLHGDWFLRSDGGRLSGLRSAPTQRKP